MRTTEIGACTPPSGTTPGMRRPVRTITWPPISSRRIRFGEPTSPRASGRDRRGLQAEPGLADRGRGLVDDRVVGRAAVLEREVVALEVDLEADHVGREHAQRLLEQLLPGLVALEHDDRPRVHGADSTRLAGDCGGLERRAWRDAGAGAAWGRKGRFRYLDSRGEADHGSRKSSRGSRRSCIPPAWRDVWISPRREREAPGDRARPRGPAPVPLPPGVPSAAGAGEIRQADSIRRATCRICAKRWPSTWTQDGSSASACAPSRCG